MKKTDPNIEEYSLVPTRIVFNFMSDNSQISEFIDSFTRAENNRLRQKDDKDKLRSLLHQLNVLKKLYVYVMPEPSSVQDGEMLKSQKEKFRQNCSKKFRDIVRDLHLEFISLYKPSKKLPSGIASINAYFAFFSEDALNRLQNLPVAPLIPSNQNCAADSKKWNQLRTASVIASVAAGGVLGGGVGFEAYENLVQVPDVIMAAGAAIGSGLAGGTLAGGLYQFFKPSTSAPKILEAEANVALNPPSL